ncbi:MAG: chromate transporter, chromate ion transporter family [Rariglobus sp.]|jgi:chromate transporter|nr:chromate transporter, chromate ion transporter family [Rariglobus sp.]
MTCPTGWVMTRFSQLWRGAGDVGAASAVVGVLLAALYNPVAKEGITSIADVGVAVVAFALLERWKVPAWLVVVFTADLGQWVLESGMWHFEKRLGFSASFRGLSRL